MRRRFGELIAKAVERPDVRLLAGDVGGTATSVAMTFNPSVNANATVPTTGVVTSGPLTFGLSITWSGNTAAYSAQLLSLRVE